MKKALPIFVLGLVLISAGAWFFGQNYLAKKEAGTTSQQPVEQEEIIMPEGSSFDSSKNALSWSWGKTVKCTWQVEGNSGVYYVKGNKFRTEMTVADKNWFGIWVDNCNYSWTKEDGAGLKICYEKTEEEATVESQESQAPPQLQEGAWMDASFNCENVEIPDSMFQLPEEVNFTEMPQIPSQ
jgi:hypothetical protein